MIALVQRVKASRVSVDGAVIGSIGPGLTVLLGVADGDREADAARLADKVIHLRVFEDGTGRMNRSLLETDGQMLVVSQFTLLGDCRKGRRPSFVAAAPPDAARLLYRHFVDRVRTSGIAAQTGRFGAVMEVTIVNDGPVTLILQSR